jgi:hypothetical protein
MMSTTQSSEFDVFCASPTFSELELFADDIDDGITLDEISLCSDTLFSLETSSSPDIAPPVTQVSNTKLSFTEYVSTKTTTSLLCPQLISEEEFITLEGLPNSPVLSPQEEILPDFDQLHSLPHEIVPRSRHPLSASPSK